MELNNIPVEVICLIDDLGKITPLKIRIRENGETITAKIDEVLYSKESNYAGFTLFDYGCKVSIHEIDQMIELRYYVMDHKWKINRTIWR